jgi:hypothetical protein
LKRLGCNSARKLLRAGAISPPTIGGDCPMSNEAGNIIPLDRYRAPGTYMEARLEQSHGKQASTRSSAFVSYGWSATEDVICSKTTLGILQSLINPNSGEDYASANGRFLFGDSVTFTVASFWIIRWTRSEVTMRASLAIVSTIVVLLAVRTLTIMNKACKSGRHEWCAPMSTVVSASIGRQFTCVCVLRRRLVAQHHLWLLS